MCSFCSTLTRHRSRRHEIGELFQDTSAYMTECAIHDDYLAVAACSGSAFCFSVFRVDGAAVIRIGQRQVRGEITCLALTEIFGEMTLCVGLWGHQNIFVEFHTLLNFPTSEPKASRIMAGKSASHL